MCTAVSFCASGRWFGRNLDLNYFGGEAVTLLPRRAEVRFLSAGHLARHAALMGMAQVADGRALFYDAMNEHGLAMAALHFPDGSHYAPPTGSAREIASFEVIEYILCRCASLSDARRALTGLRITDAAFSAAFPPTPLHWMLSDGQQSLTIEATADGVQVHDNPAGVLTNAPDFPWHLTNLHRYRALHPGQSAFGLPGDYSSASRFVRAAWVRAHSRCATDEELSQVLHILRSVEMPRGSVEVDGKSMFTRYTCCCDLERRVYHYASYDDLTVHSFALQDADPEGTEAKQLLAL